MAPAAALRNRRYGHPAGAGLWLAGLFYAAVQLVMVGPRFSLGPDELIYASQVYGGPRLQWTAPRARGVPALIWPVVHVTTSVPALRLYLMALSALGLVLAYRPWLRVQPGPVAPLAALLFATLWIADFYGNEAMPNAWVALAAVAAVGYFLLSGRPGSRSPLLGVGTALALASLIRPSDSVYLAAPLTVAAAVTPVRRWRRLLAVGAGLGFGWAVWSAEAVSNWGSVQARLRAAQAEDAAGLHMNLLLYLRTLGGPLEWTPGAAHPFGRSVVLAALWWVALALLSTLGLLTATRVSRSALLLAVATALSGAFQYVFLLSVVGVRHLLPTYALLMLPAAEGARSLFARRSTVGRTLTGTALAVALLGHVGIQLRLLEDQVSHGARDRLAVQHLGAQLNAAGFRPPACAVGGGHNRALVAYWAHCSELLVHAGQASWRRGRFFLGRRSSAFPSAPQDARRPGWRLVLLEAHGTPPPSVLRLWHRRSLTMTDGAVVDLYSP